MEEAVKKPKAGRPKGPDLVRKTFWLKPEQVAWLKTIPAQGQVVRDIIDEAMELKPAE